MKPPYHTISIGKRIVMEHIAVAERALGKRLPKGSVVHHVDGNGWNNLPSNLVICPSQAYHKLLHMREDAIMETGNPDSRPCHICKQWDLPANLYFRKSKPGQWHRWCSNRLRKQRRLRESRSA